MLDKNDIKKTIVKNYHELLYREPDLDGFNYYYSSILDKKISIDDVSSIIKQSEEYKTISKKKEEFDVNFFEKKIYSQFGEDGAINFIFSVIGYTNQFFVEIGVGNGTECNTRNLLENGWKGIMIDTIENNPAFIKKEHVIAENVNNILEKYNVPKEIDLLSIDIDFNDYWVWKAITVTKPRVVVIEYNSTFPPDVSKVVDYDPEGGATWTSYYGASLLAYTKLGKSKGYDLVACENAGVNAFFILHDEVVRHKINLKDIKEIYRPPKYGDVWDGVPRGWALNRREMSDI